MSLTLASPVGDIDRRLASRRMGLRTKGLEAHEVLSTAFGIQTVGHLVRHYPRRYIDRSRVQTIRALTVDAHATVIGRVKQVAKRLTRRRQSMVTVTITDGTGSLDPTFFNQPWAAGMYRVGQELAVSGVVQLYRGRLQLANQEVEPLSGEDHDLVHTGRITPVHPASEGVSPRTIRDLMHRALERLPLVPDPLPADIVGAEELDPHDRALRDIHFPPDDAALARAIERLKFDELFTLELGVAFRKRRLSVGSKGSSHQAEGLLTSALLDTAPFEPTKAQRRAIEEIAAAMALPQPMNLLLQGDVGSGKTFVALHACLVAIQSGHQAAIMAPTEVLAGQHARSIVALLAEVGARSVEDVVAAAPDVQRSLFDQADPGADTGAAHDVRAPTGVLTYALLTAAVTGKSRSRALDGIASGEVDLVVGTHALVQDAVTFRDLSLAVIDEQHRFGLHQRMALKGKGGGDIDVLIMTATPIPRTLALTYYGDLDLAVLDEMPAGRQTVQTRSVRTELERAAAYDLVREEVGGGRQAFVVCAAIDDANRTQVKAAESEAERLATEVFPNLRVELLHGRMRPKEKERIMDLFRQGETDLLISTTVVEVGVDVPNATVMLVENAERFGLAQLHQLRGRIGRGSHPSTCILFDESDQRNVEARARIDALVRTTDGFELADEDLRLRGEGTLFDVRQAGMPDLKLARLSDDADLVRRARGHAFALIEQDPELDRHPAMLAELQDRFESSIDWLFSS